MQIDNPRIPFAGSIPALCPNAILQIIGIPSPTVSRFAINLQVGPNVNPRDDVALHIAPVFQGNMSSVLRNSIVGGQWGLEESFGHFPFLAGQRFEIMIFCDHDHFKIAINGQHFTEFRYRLPLNRVDALAIDGDVQISSIIVELPAGYVPPIDAVSAPQAQFGSTGSGYGLGAPAAAGAGIGFVAGAAASPYGSSSTYQSSPAPYGGSSPYQSSPQLPPPVYQQPPQYGGYGAPSQQPYQSNVSPLPVPSHSHYQQTGASHAGSGGGGFMDSLKTGVAGFMGGQAVKGAMGHHGGGHQGSGGMGGFFPGGGGGGGSHGGGGGISDKLKYGAAGLAGGALVGALASKLAYPGMGHGIPGMGKHKKAFKMKHKGKFGKWHHKPKFGKFKKGGWSSSSSSSEED